MKAISMCQADYVHTVIPITSLVLHFGGMWLASYSENRSRCVRVIGMIRCIVRLPPHVIHLTVLR